MALETAVTTDLGDYESRHYLGRAYAGLGEAEDATREAEKALELAYAEGNVLSSLLYQQSLAQVHAHVGDHGTAIRTLEGLLSQGYLATAQLEIDPAWDPLRADPRFQALLDRDGP